jgi:unsaturated rhamnogalacturonyl hydrolase
LRTSQDPPSDGFSLAPRLVLQRLQHTGPARAAKIGDPASIPAMPAATTITDCDTRTLLRAVVDRTISASNPGPLHADLAIKLNQWQWHQGLALYGIVRSAERLDDDDYLEFATTWVDARLAEDSIGLSINTTAPLLAVSRLYELTRRESYKNLCDLFARWCLTKAPRLPDGTFEHSCTENQYPQQVWADTLFMGCLFLAKWGRITGNRHLIAEAARQFIQHHHYLLDGPSGLIFHGYCDAKAQQQGVLWGRGNGWFASASAEVLPLLDQEPQYNTIAENLSRHLQAVLRVQHKSGAWHTVLNHPDTYLEQSSTAAFVHALKTSAKQGLLIPSATTATLAGVTALKSAINEHGELTQASGGTPVMPTAADYGRVPYAVTCFSQGLAMLALCESL